MKSLAGIRERIRQIRGLEAEVKDELRSEKGRTMADADERHLIETGNWIARAQDVNGDFGVSRGYSATALSQMGYRGWEPSYPETTGYIVPTIICYAGATGDESIVTRALKMADWEIDIQMLAGAVMGSVVTARPSPAIFNTGQVIFGWLAAFKESGNQKYLNAAVRAGDYLLSVQEKDGSWIKGNSKYALKKATTYNTRVAWALIELGTETSENKYVDAGRKKVEYALSKQQENGWFRDNCLSDPVYPLLHTIGYATQGVLESGICLNETRYVGAAIRTLDALLKCQRPDGGFPGRLATDWSSKEKWDCLTGDVQVAISWLRVYSLTGEQKYREAARRAIDFVKKSQNLEHTNPGIRGGVKGSFPFDGPYGQFEMLNWAAKFFCDALMMINHEQLANKGIKG